MNALLSRKVLFGAGGIACALLAGLYATSFQSPNTPALSKFVNTTEVTNQNAASLWQASNDNPYRVKLGGLATKTDAVVVAILRKGTTLSPAGFNTFLSSLNTGISTLGKKPAYASNAEVQNIIGYLTYEITDTEKILAATNNAFYTELATVITTSTNTASIVQTTPSTSSTTQNTQSPQTTTTTTSTQTNNQVTSSSTNSCSGTVPSGIGVTTQGYATATPGPVTVGTVWAFKKDTQQYGCTWDCDTGYERDGNNGCKARPAGSGYKIKITNPASNNAGVAGVKVDVIHNLLNATSVVGTYTTNANGETSEFFIPEHIQQNFIIYGFTKEGMKITGASGCQSRVTRGFNFCDSPSSKIINVTMGSDQETTLTLRDSSIAYGSVLGIISTVIEGAEAGLVACTAPATNGAACDNPSTALATQPGWSYDASAKKYTASLDVSGDGWPNQEYRTCLRNPGQSVQCFNFTARNATMNHELRFTSNNGSTISAVTGYISNAGKNLLACTQLASSGECEPTTILANQPGWSYTNGSYSVNLNVDGQGWPKTSYISCYKSAGIAKTCFTTNAN